MWGGKVSPAIRILIALSFRGLFAEMTLGVGVEAREHGDATRSQRAGECHPDGYPGCKQRSFSEDHQSDKHGRQRVDRRHRSHDDFGRPGRVALLDEPAADPVGEREPRESDPELRPCEGPVSYTHLTLPTIL